MNKGIVYLIGAGCGEYDLITLRGLELLKKCDTIVYDSLIDEKILDFADKGAEKIFVGKRAGKPSQTQEKINSILIEKALEGKKVARLKGGDSFVFGRGGEEIIALNNNDIPFELVPGITSAVAVPEMAGIPVTHRSVSRSFHVITGHTKEDRLPKKMSVYAKLDGTLVFLMGLGNLKNIADSLLENGKSPETPVAVISNGGRKNQKVIRATLGNITVESEKNNMESPAVIVIGETAEYNFFDKNRNNLDGITVTVTGTKGFSDRLAVKLESNGAEVTRESILKIISYFEDDCFTNAICNISDYTMIVLTSPNGAEIFIRKLLKMKTDFRKLNGIRFAVIGNATSAVLESRGIYADIIPESFTSEELGKAIVAESGSCERVLILRAEQSTHELTDILSNADISFKEVKIYDVIEDEKNIPSEIKTDFIVFASGSGVRDFYRQGYKISDNTKVICIGASTANELKKYSNKNAILPDKQNADSIVELLKKLKG